MNNETQIRYSGAVTEVDTVTADSVLFILHQRVISTGGYEKAERR